MELLQAFSEINQEEFELRIFGEGPLENDVIEYTNNDSRIFYGGLVQSDELQNEYENADLLVNIRNPGHYVTKFSFPSKLIEYISKGKPILSTNLNFNTDLASGLYIIDDVNPTIIKDKILKIESDSEETKNIKIKIAQRALTIENNWDKIIKEVEVFLEEEI